MAPDRSLREFRLDRLVRAFELTSTLDFNVVLAEDSSLVSPFVREFVAAACQPGLDLRVRWIAWSGLDATTSAIESLMDEPSGERRILVIDLSSLRRDESRAATQFAARLNLRRDPFGRRIVGTFLLALPAWLEADFATAAPDLWSVMTTVPLARSQDLGPRLDAWWDACERRFAARLDEQRDARDRYHFGTMTVAYVLDPGKLRLSLDDLRDRLASVPGYTGWRPWWVPTNVCPPSSHEGALECWMFGEDQMLADPAHSDFWRAEGSGMFYLVRGHEEDSDTRLQPATALSTGLPLWRCGEMLLHAYEFVRSSGLEDQHLRMRVRWTGLAGRTLTSWPNRRPFRAGNERCTTNTITSEANLTTEQIATDLAGCVDALTRPLFDAFELHRTSPEYLEQQLDELRARRP